MTAYNIDSYKSTSNGAVVFLRCGALATALVVAPIQAEPQRGVPLDHGLRTDLGYAQYSHGMSSATVATAQMKSANVTPVLQDVVAKFYADLSGAQESLGDHFSEILADNLWELYVRA